MSFRQYSDKFGIFLEASQYIQFLTRIFIACCLVCDVAARPAICKDIFMWAATGCFTVEHVRSEKKILAEV